MINPEFQNFKKLKEQLQYFKTLCPHQYFKNELKCKHNCGRRHVDREYFPCLHFYLGNCKYGYKCQFRHSIKRKLVRPQPADNICRGFYEYGVCYQKKNCKYSHDVRGQPCVHHSNGGCKYTALECRYSHELKAESIIPCFFNLMSKCRKEDCQYSHRPDITRYVSYEGL